MTLFSGNEDDVILMQEFAKHIPIKLKNIEVHIFLTQRIIFDDIILYYM